MKRSVPRKLALSVIGLLILAVSLASARHWYVKHPGYGLPFQAEFTPEAGDRWTALGGIWEVASGSMRNDSNDRGAKLLAGSPNWKDYIVEGDFQMLGAGSVGVLSRVSEAEVGENAFKGYFAGVRTVDNSLVLGAYEFAYHEAAKVPMPDSVRPFRWYHVKLRVEGCRITASAWALDSPEVKTASLNDPYCFQAGSIGLRSNGTGGVWRNVRVLPLNSPEAAEAGDRRSVTKIRMPPAAVIQAPGRTAPLPVQPVRALQYLPTVGAPMATVRGSVILTRPAVFVEDSTWGVEIQTDGTVPLKIGDEVEVTGEAHLEQFSPVLRKAQVRRLREAVPISPTVMSANQVAEGFYDSRFVQVEGYLRTIAEGEAGTLNLELDAGPQSFRAVLPAGRSRSHLQSLTPESRLRLKGVSVVDSRFNLTGDPFVLLVRSAEDVEVVARPPWWTPSTLILASLAGLALVFVFNHLYLLAKHWRFRAVADERERLAHEIHDTLAQSFAGIGFQLQAIRNSVPSGAGPLESQVNLAIEMARASHGEARRSIASLRPQTLEQIGLIPALRECAERMVRNGNLTVETYGEEIGRSIPPLIKDTFYRIGLEAIANSIRHADPATIRIRLHRTRTTICLSVEDNGKGFNASEDQGGFGMRGMRNRAESISATLSIRSTPGGGTQVRVKAAMGSRFLLGLWPPPGLFAKDV